MTEMPDIPDEFDSEEEINEHLDQLQQHIDFLEEQLEQPEKEHLEAQQELEEIKEKASQSRGGFQSLLDPLEAMQERLEEFEEENLDQYGEAPSKEAKKDFFDAAGWHPDDN